MFLSFFLYQFHLHQIPGKRSANSKLSGLGKLSPFIGVIVGHGPMVRLNKVAMDKIVFKQPVFVGDLVSFFTETVSVGTTSVTAKVSVWAQRRSRSHEFVYVTEALVTMVAVDDQFRKIPIQKHS